MRKALRAVLLTTSVIALVGLNTPPALAGTSALVVFNGVGVVTGGLGYPCSDMGTTPDPAKCPGFDTNLACTVPSSKCGTTYVTNGNWRTGGLVSTVCVGLETDAADLKPHKPPASLDINCSITKSFIVHGFCGLSHGMGTGLVTINGNIILFDYLFNNFGVLILLLQWWKGAHTKPATTRTGMGVVSVVPEGSTTGQSCVNKTQTTFRVSGSVLVLPI
jgi:hypothetical protein